MVDTAVEEAVCRMSIAMGDPSYVRPKIWTGAKSVGWSRDCQQLKWDIITGACAYAM